MAEQVKIKPLEWHEDIDGDFEASSIVGWYSVIDYGDHIALNGPDFKRASYASTQTGIEQAKEDAQADFEARIRSALQSGGPEEKS